MKNKLFCPYCGNGEQEKNAYCRSCGEFLPDFENIRKRGLSSKTPEENIKSSVFLSLFGSTVSFIMAILLYVTHLGKEDAHPIIFIAAAFFVVIGVWQMVNVFTGFRLKNQFQKRREGIDDTEIKLSEQNSSKPLELLNEADFADIIPASVTEKTTNKLTEKISLS